ncbi:hypothetical protein K504DRAFT_445839 [Pleomassaria siparia CBS 279.74]|uniref:Uncharacterized protein n=1 Tax=Pleomassaria siparia CBS 279.74 TaxID=1314801 RepID=A0A6G1KPY1_9PLEO|nr:hypothetical protein K504DRAFT_445839 [Pleomassaria siparia CBS 279.74]
MHGLTIGDLCQRIATFLEDAKSNDPSLHRLVSKEMLDHQIISEAMLDHQLMTELKAAKKYIKNAEEREKELRAENERLTEELTAAKTADGNEPDDFKQLKMELAIKDKHVEFLRGLLDASEDRASKFNRKLVDALSKQAKEDVKAAQIEALELKVAQQRAKISELVDSSEIATEVIDMYRDNHMVEMKHKDMEMMELEKQTKAALDYAARIESESEAFEATYNDLIQRIEHEHGDVAAALNKAAERFRITEKEQCAAVSEINILKRFLTQSHSALRFYQQIFQQLFNNSQNKVVWLPDTLRMLQNSAKEECAAFKEVHKAFDAEGLDRCVVRDELENLAITADGMHATMEQMYVDVSKFLMDLRKSPDLLLSMKRKFRMIA